MTLVDRATRCIVAWAVCLNRTPELMQSVVGTTPHAASYYSDALNTHRELCWWGAHRAMYDKSQTYPVESVNAALRHYLARLGRRSRCFSRRIDALRRALTCSCAVTTQVSASTRATPRRLRL